MQALRSTMAASRPSAGAANPRPPAAAAAAAAVPTRRFGVVARGLKENVAALPPIDGVEAVVVQLPDGPWRIPNAPGKAASARIYAYVGASGAIDAAAAAEGLRLYGEYVEEARNEPGSHPNIDVLFRIQAEQLKCPVSIERSL